MYVIAGLTLYAVLMLAGVSIYYAGVTGRTAGVIYETSLVGVIEATEIELLLDRHRRILEAAPYEVDPEQLRRNRRTLEGLAGRIEALAARSDAAVSGELASSLTSLVGRSRDVLRNAERGQVETSRAAAAQYSILADVTQQQARAARVERFRAADQKTSELARQGRALARTVALLAIAAILLIGPASLLLMRGVTKRLRMITQAMVRLAQNDTSVELSAAEHSGDEISDMARAVAVFRSNAVTLIDQKRRLEQLNLWLDVALNNMARGLSMFDAEQRLMVSNAAYARMYELPPELVCPGTHFRDIIEHRKTRVAKLAELVVDPEQVDSGERARVIASVTRETRTSLVMKSGLIFEVSIRPLESGGWVALHEDVTERRRAADQIARLARHDTLTGLANRHQFKEQLEASAAALTESIGFAVHCIDLDRFKEVNDTLGHPAGDRLLEAVAGRLQSIVRSGDLVARLGGDEFALIQREVGSQSAAEALATRVIEAIRAPYQIHGQKVEIGATVGIVIAPADGSNPDELLKKADMALYRAKSDGRGRHYYFDPQLEGRLKARRQIEIDLYRAIEEEQFELHYQPIIDLARRRVSGCEALIRWRHPERGMISPGEFIPVAESIGLIPVIGDWAIRVACAAAATWPGKLRVAVNLSPAQFGTSDLVHVTTEALARSGLNPSRLELEVTESLILEDKPETVGVLHKLRSLGVRISLDDFGTGYSSLSYLRRFPFDKIKIDQSFVRDLSQRPDCVAIVGAVAQLACSLSMTTVAEGVETGDHLTKVQAAGCTEAQGYLFSRPVPADKIVAVMRACDLQLADVARVA